MKDERLDHLTTTRKGLSMKIIRVYESLLQSVISDSITFGMLFSLWYLNHRFCDGSGVIDFCVSFFVVIIGTSIKKEKYTVKTAVEFLQSEEAQQYMKEKKQ